MTRGRGRLALLGVALALLAVACGDDGDEDGSAQTGSTTTAARGQKITIYSGRNEKLVKPLLDQFSRDTGVRISVRYADSAALAAQLLEEGARSPADVFLSQDAGALGAVAQEGLLGPAPAKASTAVDPRFRASDDTWVGVSGRARVIVYNPGKVAEADVPKSVFALTDPKWKGRIAVAPTNASFQAFVTAMRVQVGEARTKAWLEGIEANDPKTFPGNAPIVQAVDEGQVDLGLVNHYYVYERGEAVGRDKVVARNAFLAGGDPGALVNVSGVGILKSTKAPAASATFVEYLLSPKAQRYFAEETFEYPLVAAVPTAPGLPPLSAIESPKIDLASLSTLEETLRLIRDAGLL